MCGNVTEIKEIADILEEIEKYCYSINKKIIKSLLDKNARISDLARDLNVYGNSTVEFWINNKLYYPNDNVKLIDLGFNPITDFVEIKKNKYTEYNSPELSCSLRDKEQIGIEKIKLKVFPYSKIIYVWEEILDNLEKIWEDLSISLKFRKSLSDNKFEKMIVEQISNKILDLTENFFEEIRDKLGKLE